MKSFVHHNPVPTTPESTLVKKRHTPIPPPYADEDYYETEMEATVSHETRSAKSVKRPKAPTDLGKDEFLVDL